MMMPVIVIIIIMSAVPIMSVRVVVVNSVRSVRLVHYSSSRRSQKRRFLIGTSTPNGPAVFCGHDDDVMISIALWQRSRTVDNYNFSETYPGTFYRSNYRDYLLTYFH